MNLKYSILRVFGVHRIHHITHGYGYKIVGLPIGLFSSKLHSLRNKNLRGIRGNKIKSYHNCTKTKIF